MRAWSFALRPLLLCRKNQKVLQISPIGSKMERKNNMSKKENIKPLRELNLMNRFLFSEAMEDPDNIITMLEIILDCKLSDIKNFQTEKEERIDTLSKTARLDLFVSDTDGTVYDVEAQIENTYNLPKRSRYYNATIDSHLIEVGDIDYNKLNDTYVIMICSFDLFHKGKYKYTFKMRCEEDDNLYLNDGATRIFLNTKGKNASEVSSSLIELLKYMENTTEEMAESCVNPEIKNCTSVLKKYVPVRR